MTVLEILAKNLKSVGRLNFSFLHKENTRKNNIKLAAMSEEKAKEQELEQEQTTTAEEQTDAQPKAEEKAKEEVKEEPATEPEKRIVEENIDYKDKYIRLSAEFDNYRKRTLKEKMDFLKTASSEILQKLLPVKDNFERALQSMESAKDVEALKEGVDLIYTSFSDILKQNGLKEIEALHQEFNVDVHEALTKIPAPSEDLKGKVVDVIEKGYKLNDKVIRYAKVVIGE